MARLTISLPDDVHQALKETAARRRRTIGEVVAESLVEYGVKTRQSAEDLVQRARRQASLSEEEALALAVDETRAARRS
jgi:predicted transcriptional regulator